MTDPTMVKGQQADFIAAVYLGQNTSGLRVYGKNLLIRVDPCSPVTAGGVQMTDDFVEKHTEGSDSGCIFAMGPEAFTLFDDGSRWNGPKPQVGERVYFERYAGQYLRGIDGVRYRVMDYRAIAAGLDLDNPDVQAWWDGMMAAAQPAEPVALTQGGAAVGDAR